MPELYTRTGLTGDFYNLILKQILCSLMLSIFTCIFNWHTSFVPESMRWLRLQGRHADVIKILKKVAKVNGKYLPDGVELKSWQKTDSKENKKGSVLDLFRPRRMLLFSTAQGFGW